MKWKSQILDPDTLASPSFYPTFVGIGRTHPPTCWCAIFAAREVGAIRRFRVRCAGGFIERRLPIPDDPVPVTALVLLLFAAIETTYLHQHRLMAWVHPVQVAIIPIAASASPDVQAYVDTVDEQVFSQIASFLDEEASDLGVSLGGTAVEVHVLPQIREQPPAPPSQGSLLSTIIWSLRLRHWAGTSIDDGGADIRVFVLYHRAERGSALPHSLGLEKGRIGVVHAFAAESAAPTNEVIITHELLHALGASDKYDDRGLPAFPEGYAEPDLEPRYPQTWAEIMGAQIPLAAGRAVLPNALEDCVIGPKTAQEIGWNVSTR